MNPLGYLCIGAGILVVLMIALTLNRVKNRKVIASGLYGVNTLIALLFFIVLLLSFSNLNTYNRLVYESDIADILIAQSAEQQYQLEFIPVELPVTETELNKFQLSGDEWRLDARILKWKGWANIIGLDSYYQLERLSGRYSNIEQTRSLLPSAYQLSGQQKGLNIWKLKQVMLSNLPFLDAYYGQSVFMPMRDSARFRLSISQSGLIVRPTNEAASKAMEGW